VFREPADALAFGYRLGIPVTVALDHGLTVAQHAINVSCY
jgi:hypothetical protein